MHDQPAPMRLPIEPPERDADHAELVEADGAPGPPRRTPHQVPDPLRERPDARTVRRRRGGDRYGGNQDER